jgi:hemerythrin-like domain-containing protein
MLDVTAVMVEEHRLILRMIALVEHNARLVEEGRFEDWDFFLDAVDFIRNYADRFHHAKEEDVLFKELVKNGMPADNSPVAAMLMAHDEGRAFVKEMEAATLEIKSGNDLAGNAAKIVKNGAGYTALLTDHIDKEDNILYPLAERVLPEERRPAMVAQYQSAERAAPEGLEERYRKMVEDYEAKAALN